MKPLLLAWLAALSALAGCAYPGNALRVTPGASREQVLATAGTPTRIVPLPEGGQRLQYSLQPWGRYAYMVDLDAAGKVVRARQVLNAEDFKHIQPGVWTRADVEREFGPPASIDTVSSWNGTVMTYRWYEQGEMFYWVYLDPQGVVRRAHPGMEFINGPPEPRQ